MSIDPCGRHRHGRGRRTARMELHRSRRDILKIGGLAVGGALVSGGVLAETMGAFASTPGAVQPAAAASAWDQVPVILSRIVPPTFAATNFDVTAFGAKGDGR